jgi:endogenous inhibitor of DNA gyrase (YacG/DUF329 family)
MNKSISCPMCNKATKLDISNLNRPFCSERCRLIDLGKWANEKYGITDGSPVDDVQIYPETH